MTLSDAIKLAQTEHVVYFLLTSYAETLDFYDPIPARAKRLPMAGEADVRERLRILRELCTRTESGPMVHAVIEEAVDVFGAALQRLAALNFQTYVSTVPDLQVACRATTNDG